MNAEPYWLSRITPRSELSHRQLVSIGCLDPYGQHQALWKLFDVTKKERTDRAEFLFRAEQMNGLPVFFVLSRLQPQDRAGIWRVEPKSYRPDIRAGDCLAFKLRANPTVARAGQSGGKSKRHDVVMDAKARMGWKEMLERDRPSLAHLAFEAGACWIRERQRRLGFKVDDGAIRVDGYRAWRQHHGKRVGLATLDFEGRLIVTDSKQFVETALFRGIGHSKAFGCGLLLVRRIYSHSLC